MDKIDWQAVISAFVALATGVGLYLQNKGTAKKVEDTSKKVDANTEITQKAANAAEQVQVETVNRLNYDRLQQMERAVLTLEECEPCREKILAITDRRRVYRHTPDATEAK